MIEPRHAEVQGVVRTPHAPGRQIPYAFRADPVALDELRLDPTARQVFTLVLDNGRNRGMRSRLSNGTMGRILGRCPMTISRALGRLEAAGLVRRELIAGGRIRLAIHVTWEGVRRDGLTGQASVRREDLTGSTRESNGLGADVELTRAPIQSERTDGGSPPSRGEAGAYLKACVAAARRGEPMPEPPGSCELHSPPPDLSHVINAPAPALANSQKGSNDIGPLPLTPTMLPGASMAEIGRMVRGLGERLKADGCGPRRVGPARLARQLAEMRRKHGRRE